MESRSTREQPLRTGVSVRFTGLSYAALSPWLIGFLQCISLWAVSHSRLAPPS